MSAAGALLPFGDFAERPSLTQRRTWEALLSGGFWRMRARDTPGTIAIRYKIGMAMER